MNGSRDAWGDSALTEDYILSISTMGLNKLDGRRKALRLYERLIF